MDGEKDWKMIEETIGVERLEWERRRSAGGWWRRRTRVGNAEVSTVVRPWNDLRGVVGYETALFVHGRFHVVLDRYPTRGAAIEGHRAACRTVRLLTFCCPIPLAGGPPKRRARWRKRKRWVRR